jgi:hypothetical protein
MGKVVEMLRTVKNDKGCLGTLTVDREFISFTVELPDRGNKPNVSCFPAGAYTLRKTTTSKTMPDKYRGVAYVVEDVPGRSQIKFHVANKPSELLGCVGPNETLDSKAMVGGRSKAAVKKFMDAMDGVEEAILVVREA